MATCSFSHFKPSKFSGREDIILLHFVFWALIGVSELSRTWLMQLLLHQAVFSVVFNCVCIHPHCVCIWIAWGNWTVYFSCFTSNTSLCSWQELGLVPPNTQERWANICRSLNSIFVKDGSRFWFLRDFQSLACFPLRPQTTAVFWRTLVICLALWQMCLINFIFLLWD